jgi:hypothetical protein
MRTNKVFIITTIVAVLITLIAIFFAVGVIPQTVIMIISSLVVAGLMKMRFGKKMRWYHILISLVCYFIVLNSFTSIFLILLMYNNPFPLILEQIKNYWIWYLFSVMILVKVILITLNNSN